MGRDELRAVTTCPRRTSNLNTKNERNSYNDFDSREHAEAQVLVWGGGSILIEGIASTGELLSRAVWLSACKPQASKYKRLTAI